MTKDSPRGGVSSFKKPLEQALLRLPWQIPALVAKSPAIAPLISRHAAKGSRQGGMRAAGAGAWAVQNAPIGIAFPFRPVGVRVYRLQEEAETHLGGAPQTVYTTAARGCFFRHRS